MGLLKNKGIFLVVCLVIFMISINAVIALKISPSELKIKNVQFDKNYQFILLLTNEEPGLRNFQVKASEPYVKISPDKFMLEEGEKKSIKISVSFPKNLETEEGKITITPFINNQASQQRTVIKYNMKEEEEDVIEEESVEKEVVFYKNKKIMLPIIYALIASISIIMALVVLPDIKKTTSKANKKYEKQVEQIKKKKEPKSNIKVDKEDIKKIQMLENQLEKADKNIQKITEKIEKFIDYSNHWLKDKSGGKYGLE